MKAQRTPWWYYLLAALIGLIGGLLLVKIDEVSGLTLIGAPWVVPAVLLVLGIAIFISAQQIHRYANTEPAKRSGFIDPTRAVYTLVLAKALGIAGAALTGWYVGQIIMSLSHTEVTYYQQVIVECAVTAAVCLIDMVIGIISEGLCQLPPGEGPEHPKIQELQRRRELAEQPTKQS